jgi:hypothetical protein
MKSSREIAAERGSAVSLRVDYVAGGPTEPVSTVHCTDIEGTEVQMTVKEQSATDIALETGEWYRFDGVVRSRSLGAHLLFSSGDSAVERIDAPKRRAYPPLSELDNPWLVQLGANDDCIAVTVQPRPTNERKRARAEDPKTFEIGAVCLAHCDRTGDATVYHREEPDTRDEHLLLEHVVDDLSEAAGATLVTRGSSHSPLELLHQRLTRASDGDIVATGAERVLDKCFHASTEGVAVRAEADRLCKAATQFDIEVDPVLLSDYEIGTDPADWRESWETDDMPFSDVSDPRMTDRDYATLVERYLSIADESVESGELGRCLKAYASTDLSLIRKLVASGAMDRLGCRQLSGRLLER